MEQSNDIFAMSSNTKHRDFEDEQEDRISSLPDCILLHILSFLPTKDAVKTVLLRRFGNLWTSIQTLDFDGRSYHKFAGDHYNKWITFTDFVVHVLLHYECPTIFKFSLKLGSYLYFSPNDMGHHRHNDPMDHEFADDIDSWIDFALSRDVKILDVGILAHRSSSTRFDYDLPDYYLLSDSLTELKLVNVGLGQQEEVRMKSLKTLSLTTIKLSDTMIEQILSGCPLLESLSIIQCYGLRKLNCTSTYLKSLMIVLGEYNLFESARVEISGPNLMSIHISGLKGLADLKNLSSLVEATLDLRFGGTCPVDDYRNVAMLLEKLHDANIFTICNWCILVVSLWELTNVPCPSSSRKSMVLKTMLTKWHIPGITSLLRNSPNLEILSIYIEADALVLYTDNDLRLGLSGIQEENYWNDEMWLKSYDFDEENYWNSQPPFSCLMNHLKTVKISGCITNSYLLQIVKFLLGCSCVLEKMVIFTKQSNQQSYSLSKELLGFSQKLSSFPKASDHAVILFS